MPRICWKTAWISWRSKTFGTSMLRLQWNTPYCPTRVSAFLVHSIRFCTMQSEVADVLRKVGSKIESYGLTWQLRTLYAIKCRTAELGGHIDVWWLWKHYHYNSCRNRHCPKCQTNAKIGSRLEKQNSASAILPRGFTFDINSLAIHQPKLVYDTLFLKRHGNTKTKAKEMQMEW
jgi:hypothetical protein